MEKQPIESIKNKQSQGLLRFSGTSQTKKIIKSEFLSFAPSNAKKHYSTKKTTSLQEMGRFERPNSSILLAYTAYHKTLQNIKNKQTLSKSLINKSAPKVRTNRQMLDVDQVSSLHKIPDGITDVDKNYFKIIQVRSKDKTRKLNRHQYLTDINNCLRENIVTGYFYDEIFKINEQFHTENTKLAKIKDNFSKFSGYFEMFLGDDHKESMELMAAATRETSETEKRRDILRKKQKQLGMVRNEIYSYEEIYERTLNCAAFILSITPEDFYKNDEIINEEPLRRSLSTLSDHSLDDLEKQLHKVKDLKPQLYFKDPWEILQIFRDIEVQNLKFMLHTLEFKAKIQEQMDLITLLENFSGIELHNIRYKVNKTDMAIKTIEIQTKHLEERCKILLDQEYKEFVSGNQSILIHAYIAETVSYVMGIEPDDNTEVNLDAIGTEYKKLKFQADSIPSELFYNVLTAVYNRNKLQKIKAKAAVRRLIDFDILINRTLKLLDKPEISKRRKLMTRSPVTIKPKPKPKPPPSITEEELLQLYLFTDMCLPQNPIIEIDSDEGTIQ